MFGILAEKDGVTYAVQCKRYNGPVGVEAVLRTYGARVPYNGGFHLTRIFLMYS